MQDTDSLDDLQEKLTILRKLVEKSPKKIADDDHSIELENLTKAKAAVNGV